MEGGLMTTPPPPVIRITEQEARTEEWRRDFVRSAFAAEQADRDAVKDARHLYLMGEFALVLAAYGVLVDYKTLERLAYVAVGGA
jgi:hypothetical protein